MPDPTLQQSVDQFKEDQERLRKFVNEEGGYLAEDGTPVKSLRDFNVTLSGYEGEALSFRNEAEGFAIAAGNSEANVGTDAANAALSAAKALAAAETSGNVVFYDTYALANADVGSLPDLQIVQVLVDETRQAKRTIYRKEGGVLVFKTFADSVNVFDFEDRPTLRLDTSLTYTAGLSGSVVVGDVILTRKEGAAFVVVASTGDLRYDEATTGGVKLLVTSRAVGRGRQPAGRGVTPAIVPLGYLTHLNSNWPGLITGSWNVTGVKGSATLTYTGGTAITSLTQANLDGSFPVALVSDDDVQLLTAIVTGNDGVSEIYLREPLEADLEGVLTSWGDAPNGQHLTQNGYRVWAKAIAEATDFDSRRGENFGLGFSLLKRTVTPWSPNAAYLAAPGNDGGVFPDRVNKHNFSSFTASDNVTSTNMVSPVGSSNHVAVNRTSQAGRYSFGMWQVGHGIEFRTSCRGNNAFLEGWIGATHPVRNLNTFYGSLDAIQIRIRVTQDDVVVYEKIQNHVLRAHRVKLFRAGDVKIEITLLTATSCVIEACDFSLRKAGEGGRLIQSTDRVLVGMDSWGAFFGEAVTGPSGQLLARGQVARELELRTGCQCFDVSEGGRTGPWVLAFLQYWIDLYQPDVFITDMAINDATLGTNFNFTGPDGATYAQWIGEGYIDPIQSPNNVANDVQEGFFINQNLKRMAEICAENGVKLIYAHPGAVPSSGQTQVLAAQVPWLDYSAVATDMISAPALDFSNAHSLINEQGKYPGRRVWHSGLNAVYVATGFERLSTWARQDDPTVTITPTDTTAPTFFSRNSQNVKTGLPLVFAVQADEPVTFTITGGADSALFSLGDRLDSKTQMLVLPAQDVGAPADADANNTYVVQVTATDVGGNTANQTITITVRP